MADKKAAAETAAKASGQKRASEDTGKKKPSLLDRAKGFFGRIAKYFKDTKSELKKVVWPSRKDVRTKTITVVVVVLIAAVVLILLDLAFGGIIHLLIGA